MIKWTEGSRMDCCRFCIRLVLAAFDVFANAFWIVESALTSPKATLTPVLKHLHRFPASALCSSGSLAWSPVEILFAL
jgi:hypothetical protein